MCLKLIFTAKLNALPKVLDQVVVSGLLNEVVSAEFSFGSMKVVISGIVSVKLEFVVLARLTV